jgi:hypothetical protein
VRDGPDGREVVEGEGLRIILKICDRPPAGGQEDGKTGRVPRGAALVEGAAGGAAPPAVNRAGHRGEPSTSPVWALHGHVGQVSHNPVCGEFASARPLVQNAFDKSRRMAGSLKTTGVG